MVKLKFIIKDNYLVLRISECADARIYTIGIFILKL